jgi:hypothetical protein
MKTFLIIAERPKLANGDDDVIVWRTFLAGSSKAFPPSRDAKKLPEGIWQMPLDAELGSLLGLLQFAAKHEIAVQLALLEEKPNWIKCS